MRLTRIVLVAVVLAFAAVARPAFAETEFEVSVASGQITVTTHKGWHINKEYPWKLTVGDQKLDKSKFSLEETTATLNGAPKGSATLKGAVCSADECHPFKKELTIQ